jgi:hypothetical protein
MIANNNIEENDLENEKEEEMVTKKRIKPKKQGKWITKKYGKTSSATFYIPKIKISSVFKETKKRKKRR